MSPITRRAFCGGVGASVLFRASKARAGEVPPALQARLATQFAAYDRNMKARAGDRVGIVIVTKRDDVESDRMAGQLMDALGQIPAVASLPHWSSTVIFSDGGELRNACAARRTSLVYVTAALVDRSEEIRAAFDGRNILTCAPSAEMAKRGLVLGMELVESRPKLFFNAAQASRQSVLMSSEVLRLVTFVG